MADAFVGALSRVAVDMGYKAPVRAKLEPKVVNWVAIHKAQWRGDVERLYPMAIRRIEATIQDDRFPKAATDAAKWVAERYLDLLKSEAAPEAALNKPPSEMTLAELEASVARLAIIAGAAAADDAEVVSDSVFD